MDLIDIVGRTVIKNDKFWIKVAEVEGKIGFGIVNPDGTKMKSIWVQITNRLE